jgi:hypothetical protein
MLFTACVFTLANFCLWDNLIIVMVIQNAMWQYAGLCVMSEFGIIFSFEAMRCGDITVTSYLMACYCFGNGKCGLDDLPGWADIIRCRGD